MSLIAVTCVDLISGLILAGGGDGVKIAETPVEMGAGSR